jgi:RNA polymerase sigma factor (sigma-70 family)
VADVELLESPERMGRVTSSPDFDELWARLRLPMLQLAVLLVDDRAAAEDVVQDAFAGLHRHLPVESPAAYLRASVLNGCRSVLRRRRLARAHLPLVDRPGAGADEALTVAEEHRAVTRAMSRLPRRQREVLVLKYWAGLSDPEIAAELRVSLGTVRSCASRARATLGIELGAEQ